MLSFWREILIAILCGTIAIGVVFWPKSQTPVTTIKTQVVEKIIAPDGTITERVVTRDNVESKKQAQYRVGPTINPLNTKDTWGVRTGARLGESPLWLDIGVRPMLREVEVGISLEF